MVAPALLKKVLGTARDASVEPGPQKKQKTAKAAAGGAGGADGD